MPLLEEAIYSRLSDFAGLSVLIGTRVYPLILPQNPVLPAVSYFRVSGKRDYVMGGATGIADPRIQVDSWANSYSGVKAIAEQVRLALSGFRGVVAGVTIDLVTLDGDLDDFESDTRIYSVKQEYLFSYREAVA